GVCRRDPAAASGRLRGGRHPARGVRRQPPRAGPRHAGRRGRSRRGVISMQLALLFMVAAAVVAIVAQRLRFPYTVALVIAGLAPRAAMLLGVIAAAIDPVSVIALVREAGLDPRLAAVLEGEAVLNDGVAIVLFTIVSGPAVGGFWPAAGQFVWLIATGGLVGVLLAAGVSYVLGRVAQPLVETLGSLILLVGSLLAAGRVGASGIIAVMCA